MAHIPLVSRFIALVEGWNAAGWGEYLLWEVLEGKRDRPFKFHDPLPEEDLEVLRRLRDEERVWPTFDGFGWETANIDEWRAHAAARSAKDIRDEMDGA